MKHRIAPLAILLLASFLYDALGLFVAIGAMTAPPLVNGPLEAMVISQALPNENPPPTALPPTALPPTALPPTALPPTALPPTDFSPTAFPLDPSLAPGPVPVSEFAIGPVPDLPPPPFLTPAMALSGDVVMAANSSDSTQSCHSAPLPNQPTAAYQDVTGLERIISHATTELTGLDAIMASALVLDNTGAAFAQRGTAARLAGIAPEIVDPPG